METGQQVELCKSCANYPVHFKNGAAAGQCKHCGYLTIAATRSPRGGNSGKPGKKQGVMETQAAILISAAKKVDRTAKTFHESRDALGVVVRELQEAKRAFDTAIADLLRGINREP